MNTIQQSIKTKGRGRGRGSSIQEASVEKSPLGMASGRTVTTVNPPGLLPHPPDLAREQTGTHKAKSSGRTWPTPARSQHHLQPLKGCSDFERKTYDVCHLLDNVVFDDNDPCQACLKVVKEYERLSKRCDAPSNPQFLKDRFQMIYVRQLNLLLDCFESEIEPLRGRELIYGLTQILEYSFLLDYGKENRHKVRRRVIALLHQYVRKELLYLEFRLRCKDSRGESLAMGSLRTLLTGICKKQNLFTVDQRREYNQDLNTLEKRLKNKDARVDCKESPFEKRIAEGLLKQAGIWVMKNEDTFMEARMFRDIMRFELNKISGVLNDNTQLSTSEKVNLLKGLSKYCRYYDELIEQVPEIKKSLLILCSVITWQAYLLLIRHSKSTQSKVCQEAKQVLEHVCWLKEKKLLNEECLEFITLADNNPEDLSIETSEGKLSSEDIEAAFRTFMQHAKQKQNSEQIRERMYSILPLLHQKDALMASGWGKVFKKSFDTVEHVILNEYFTETHEYYMKVLNKYDKNYTKICIEMERFRDICIRNKDFVTILKTSDSDSGDEQRASRPSWEMLTCKTWGKQLSELQAVQQITIEDLDLIDELIATTPALPCIQTRNRLWEVIYNFGCIAETTELNNTIKHRLSNLLKLVDNFPVVYTKNEEIYKARVHAVRDRLDQCERLTLPPDTESLLQPSTAEPTTSTEPPPSLSTQGKSTTPEKTNTQPAAPESAPEEREPKKESRQKKPVQTNTDQSKTPAQGTTSPHKRERKTPSRPDRAIYTPPAKNKKSTTVSNPAPQDSTVHPMAASDSSAFAQAENPLVDSQYPPIPEACFLTVAYPPPPVVLTPVAWVGATYEQAATQTDRVRFGFGYLEKTISQWPLTKAATEQERDNLSFEISTGLSYIYGELARACHSSKLKQSIQTAMTKFLLPDEAGAIANAIEPLKQQLLEEGQLLMYNQLIQIVHDLYYMRLRLKLSTAVPILAAAIHPI